MTDQPSDEERLNLIQGLSDSEQYENVVPLERSEDEPNLLEPWVVTGREVLDIPPPEPLVEDWIDKETVSAFYGPPKKGKTFAAIDLALCVASGTYWHGKQVEKAPVLYIAGEGIRYFGDRIDAWCVANNVSQSALDNSYFIKKAVNLLDKQQINDLQRLILKHDIGLVVVDTLARCMAGGDENSSQDMGKAVAALDRLKFANECAVLVIHHTGKDKSRGLRGSSALLGAIDSAVQVDGDSNGNIRLIAEDQRGRPEGDTIALRLQQHGKGAALVAVNRGDAFDHADMQNASKALKCLERIHTENGTKRKDWLEICKEELGWSDSTFNRAVKDLATVNLAHQPNNIRGPWFPGPKGSSDN